jgi:hypothetical protein
VLIMQLINPWKKGAIMQKGDSFLDFKARNRVDCTKRYILKNFLIIAGLWNPLCTSMSFCKVHCGTLNKAIVHFWFLVKPK